MSTKERVLDAISQSTMPTSAQHVARTLSVGWGTALRYCLELLATGRIRGMKTTKSWVFWVEEESQR